MLTRQGLEETFDKWYKDTNNPLNRQLQPPGIKKQDVYPGAARQLARFKVSLADTFKGGLEACSDGGGGTHKQMTRMLLSEIIP